MATKLLAGKHNCVGLFSGDSSEGESQEFIDRPCLLVYVGTFDSMDGEVVVTEDHLDLLIANHNAKLAKLAQIAGNEQVLCRMSPPLQLDHSTSATVTVGRVIGKLYKAAHTLDDGKTVPGLFCEKVRCLGAENVPKVRDGRWANVSIGADLEAGNLNELSITPFPAAPNASLLKAAAEESKTPSKGEPQMHEKLKKHLMEKCKMSEKDAEELSKKLRSKLGADEKEQDEKLSKMSDDEMSKMAADHDEDEKKMAKAKADEEDEKEEGKKLSARLTAAKPEIVKLAKGFSKNAKEARLAARTSMVGARLSRLRAEAKVTPAEIKKIDFVKMAAMSDSELNSVLKTYEEREPVIDARVHGTTRAVNLAKLQKDAKSAALLAETKKDLGVKLSAEEEKALSGEGGVPDKAPMDQGGVVPNHEEHMAALGKLVEGWPQREAVMSHVSKMMESMKHMGGDPAATVYDDKQMSALAENVNRLQSDYEALIKMVGEATGISPAELTE
jgi:hypothetical protein